MAEDAEPLPDGWTEVKSRSRPGEVSYMDAKTGRRVKQRPSEPAVAAYELWVMLESIVDGSEIVVTDGVE